MDAPTFIGFLFLSGLDTEEKGSRLLSHRHRAVGFVLHSLSDIERIGRNISFVPEIGRVLQHREGVVYPFADAELASLELDLGQVVAQNFHVDVVAAFELGHDLLERHSRYAEDAVRPEQFVGVLLRVKLQLSVFQMDRLVRLHRNPVAAVRPVADLNLAAEQVGAENPLLFVRLYGEFGAQHPYVAGERLDDERMLRVRS